MKERWKTCGAQPFVSDYQNVHKRPSEAIPPDKWSAKRQNMALGPKMKSKYDLRDEI